MSDVVIEITPIYPDVVFDITRVFPEIEFEVTGSGPRGEPGADGAQGPQGEPGADGAQGPSGPTAVSSDLENQAGLGSDSLLYVPTEIWEAKTFVLGDYPNNEGVPDQSAIGGPSLSEGDRVFRIGNSTNPPSIFEVAIGPWTLVKQLIPGSVVKVVWDGYINEWVIFRSFFAMVAASGDVRMINGSYVDYLFQYSIDATTTAINEAVVEAEGLTLMLGGM